MYGRLQVLPEGEGLLHDGVGVQAGMLAEGHGDGAELFLGGAVEELVALEEQGVEGDLWWRRQRHAATRDEDRIVATMAFMPPPGAFDQRGARPGVPLRAWRDLRFPAAAVVPGPRPLPEAAYASRGEAAHVIAQLGQNLLGAAADDAGDGIQPVERRLERASVLLDPGSEESVICPSRNSM